MPCSRQESSVDLPQGMASLGCCPRNVRSSKRAGDRHVPSTILAAAPVTEEDVSWASCSSWQQVLLFPDRCQSCAGGGVEQHVPEEVVPGNAVAVPWAGQSMVTCCVAGLVAGGAVTLALVDGHAQAILDTLDKFWTPEVKTQCS